MRKKPYDHCKKFEKSIVSPRDIESYVNLRFSRRWVTVIGDNHMRCLSQSWARLVADIAKKSIVIALTLFKVNTRQIQAEQYNY